MSTHADRTLPHHLPEDFQLPDLKVLAHRRVRRIPLAHDTPAFEALLLRFDSLGGKLRRSLSNIRRSHLVRSFGSSLCLLLRRIPTGLHSIFRRSGLLESLELDRQAMAIPAWSIVDSSPTRQLGAQHQVLENFIQRMSDMDCAIGIWRAIVQHELVVDLSASRCVFDGGSLGSVLPLPGIQVIGASRAVELQLFRRWTRWKWRSGQRERVGPTRLPAGQVAECG